MLVEISVTCKNTAEARKIARQLLTNKLVACANFWPVNSIFTWHGKQVNGREVLLVCKTESRHARRAKLLIQDLHSYELPTLTVSNITTTPAVTRWVKEVTK
ncbi:MAG TPA: divalent cation tolerance protein CutA [Patescibacteria group bacterium]|jgi:periplasmic divalent cation tolerance protein